MRGSKDSPSSSKGTVVSPSSGCFSLFSSAFSGQSANNENGTTLTLLTLTETNKFYNLSSQIFQPTVKNVFFVSIYIQHIVVHFLTSFSLCRMSLMNLYVFSKISGLYSPDKSSNRGSLSVWGQNKNQICIYHLNIHECLCIELNTGDFLHSLVSWRGWPVGGMVLVSWLRVPLAWNHKQTLKPCRI